MNSYFLLFTTPEAKPALCLFQKAAELQHENTNFATYNQQTYIASVGDIMQWRLFENLIGTCCYLADIVEPGHLVHHQY